MSARKLEAISAFEPDPDLWLLRAMLRLHRATRPPMWRVFKHWAWATRRDDLEEQIRDRELANALAVQAAIGATVGT